MFPHNFFLPFCHHFNGKYDNLRLYFRVDERTRSTSVSFFLFSTQVIFCEMSIKIPSRNVCNGHEFLYFIDLQKKIHTYMRESQNGTKITICWYFVAKTLSMCIFSLRRCWYFAYRTCRYKKIIECSLMPLQILVLLLLPYSCCFFIYFLLKEFFSYCVSCAKK